MLTFVVSWFQFSRVSLSFAMAWYGQPTYGQPVYSLPAYRQPVYSPPAYGQPVHSPPTYGQPMHSPPTYGQPMHSPTYGQPMHSPPTYGQQPVRSFSPNDYPMYVEWEPTWFDEGSFRYAIRGTWVRHPTKAGQKCVVKHFKESFTWTPNEWNLTIKMYNDAQALAMAFNDFYRTDRPITYADVTLMQCVQQHSSGPKCGEYIVIEDYLEGKFIKWCNNFGFWDEKELTQSMPAFMHWSWFHTKGQKMIGDLQGIRTMEKYILTDPALLSLTGEYGCTDMGIEGMALLLLNHKCNSICKNLPKPTVEQILSCLSPDEVPEVEEMLVNMLNCTTYTWQKKFSLETMGRMKSMLEFVANNS